MLRKIEAASRRVNRRLALYVSGIGILLIMTLLIAHASMRTFFAKPITGVFDISEIILAWIVFTAFAYALITGAHVRMTLVLDRLPRRLRSGCEIFANLMGVSFFAVLTIMAVPFFWESFLIKEVPQSPIPSPVWLGKLAMPIGTFLISVVFLVRLIRSLRPKREVVEEEVKREEEKGF